MKLVSVIGSFILCGVLFLSFTDSTSVGDPWNAPEKYVKMKNPVASDDTSISTGKTLYNKHCGSCHGKKGLGDGSKSAQLDTHPGDFTSKSFASQSDGSLFYKTQTGRNDMPSFKKKIPDDEDIWNIVNYVRTFIK